MKMRTEGQASRLRAWGRGLLLALGLLAFDCAKTREDPTGGETHFLRQCDDDSAPCGSSLVCVCGLCTLPCDESSTCGRFAAADCVSPPATAGCGLASGGFCDVTCTADDDCSWLSTAHVCSGGVCRSDEVPPVGCPKDARSANELVVLGDAFFAVSHRITAFLEDFARQSGALSVGERYRDVSSVTGNTLALGGAGIEGQYLAASTDSPVRVVIMTGGGADVLLGSCEIIGSDCPLLVEAAEAARALFQRMADDGVERIFYAFYPDPTDPLLRAEVDALRPLIASACQESAVPCHFVDLRPAFAGHESYLDATGTTPTPEGAEAAARQIWEEMRLQCVAQG
jgi:hypothetical protein